jgi:hypothetical protein
MLFQGGIVAVGFLILWLADVHRKAASAATWGSTPGDYRGARVYAGASTGRTRWAKNVGAIREPAHVASIEALLSPYRGVLISGQITLVRRAKES